MTDKELLESAARAAGYVLLTNGQAYSQDAGNFDWNPLTNDGMLCGWRCICFGIYIFGTSTTVSVSETSDE